MIRIQQLKLPVTHTQEELEQKIRKTLKIGKHDLQEIELLRRSIDARKKSELKYVYQLDVKVKDENAVLRKAKNNQIVKAEKKPYVFPKSGEQTLVHRPVIIGSGPAGLSSAIYAQRAGLKAVVVEKNYLGTGQISESERVDNYPGLYGENGFDLGEKFRSHAESLGTEFIEGEAVKISKNTTDYSIELDNGNSLETHTVIYAVGTERRKLQVEGEKEFSGRGVSYCAVCDAAFYKDKITAVAGGGDTALGDAALLSKFAKKVYLIHRRDKFRANKTLQQKVENISNVEILLNSQIKKINGSNKVESITVDKNGAETEIKVDGVFVAVGSVPNSAILKDLVEVDNNGYIVANEDGVTSANGIFVAGDVRTKKLRQVVTAVSDGANCVLSAEDYLEKIK